MTIKIFDKLCVLLKQLEENNFYGELSIKFEKGEIVFLKKQETIKL